jgi:hypothetical protein
MPIVRHEKKAEDALQGKLLDCSEKIVVKRVNAGRKPSGRAEALPHSEIQVFGFSGAIGSTFTPSLTTSPGLGIIVSPSESPLSTSSLSP